MALALAHVVGLVATLSGCSASEPKVIGETYTASPDAPGQSGLRVTSPTVAWIDTGKRFAVTAFGSSTCPQVPTAVTGSNSSIQLTLTTQGGPICTSDLERESYTLDVPGGVDTSDIITVTVTEGDGKKTVLALPH